MVKVTRKSPSLRKRYITFTVLLGLFVLSIAAFFYHSVITTKDAVTTANLVVQQERQSIEKLRINLLKIYRNIDLFLLDPLHPGLTANIENLIEDSLKASSDLDGSQHPYHVNLHDKTAELRKKIGELDNQLSHLFEFRMDVSRQYPGLALAANQMTAPQNEVQTKISLLIEEIESGDLVPVSDETYPLLLKARTTWINAISQMRIYLANRFASFSTDILVQQAQGVFDFQKKFYDQIERMQELYSEEDSFEGPDIIKSVREKSEEWYALFLRVRKITESNWWRADTEIMKTRIIPLIDEIAAVVQSLEERVSTEHNSINDELGKGNKTLTTLIMAIITLFLLFIITMLFSMNWMIFSPIEKVTMALRSKAFDIELPNIESAKTQEVGRLIEAFQEMDEEITHRQNALEHQAMHDHLTGMPNRFLLNQRIDYQLLSADRQKKPFTLFLMDLDHFKDINDTLGHAIGDALLIEASQRIEKLIRKSDTLARLGGDEFAILLPDMNKQEASELASKISDALVLPFVIDEQKINIGISIGIVSYPDDGLDSLVLLQRADMAMYSAKRRRIGYAYYDENENIYSTERLELTNELLDALDNEDFELFYQSKVDAKTETIVGAEALLRWNHKKFGFIPPDKIIEIAEHVGVIHKLSLWVLQQAIEQCRQWHEMGRPLSVSVNLSVRDLSSEMLSENIAAMLKQHNLDSRYLTLEITESIMMENLALSLKVLNRLNKMGVNLSIDDFGTGFSSLAYLKRLPVGELKIDKSFVIDMESDISDKEIVQSTINLGHNLGLKVVAEGIENATLMGMVKELDCDEVQGYYFSRPLPPDEFSNMVQQQYQGSA